LPARLNQKAALINKAVDSHYRCPATEYISFGLSRACPMNLPSRNPADAEVVLLGDSHAQMYAPVWTSIFAEHHAQGLLVFANGCLPTVSANYGPWCTKLAQRNLTNVLSLPQLRLVILAFTWSAPVPFTNPRGSVLANLHSEGLVAAIDDLISKLHQAGKKVILVGPIARPGWDVPSTVSRELAFGWRAKYATSMTRSAFESQFGAAIAHFSAIESYTFVPAYKAQCDDRACAYLPGGHSLYSDESHVSEYELWRFSNMFKEAYGHNEKSRRGT
jgi:hypothetical protein